MNIAKEKPIFRPSFGNRPESLIGRDEELLQIEEGLQSFAGSAERTTLVIGQRGMGKTALLLEIADRALQMDYVPVRVTCGTRMLDNLIEMLQLEGSKYIKDIKPPVKGFSAGALGFSFGLTFTEETKQSFGFRVKLEMICNRLSEYGKRVLILVDEVDSSIEEMRELATTYQELVGNDVDIAIVMAGLPSAISATLNYKTLTFLNRAQQILLDLIAIPEVEIYYHSAFERASINIDSSIVHDAAKSTNGFPYMIQLIGYYILKLSTGDNQIGSDQLEKAVSAASEEVDNKVLKAMLNPLSDMDITYLITMANIKGRIKTLDIEKELGVSHGTAQTYRKRLIESGVVFSPRRGELAFVLPQLANYLKRQIQE